MSLLRRTAGILAENFGRSFPINPETPLPNGNICDIILPYRYTYAIFLGGLRPEVKSDKLYDRLTQLIGIAVLVGLTLALLFAFRGELLPYQEDGDVFGTVYLSQPEEASSEE